MESYGCWINGERRDGERWTFVVDPSTGRAFAQATAADAPLVEAALESARRSLPAWRSTPALRRSALLHALAATVRCRADELARLLSREVGKPVGAAVDEVLSCAALVDYFAEESLRLTGEIPLQGYHRERVLIVREPVGVVAAITPFNYPLSTLASKMGPALGVGCTLVAKPDEHTPLTTLKLAELASEAGFPSGVFNVVTGLGHETGRLLVNHPVPRLITFTGSTAVGKEIQVVSARWVRKVILELGGHCPAILCADAPWRRIMPQLIAQSFKNCGQYCYRITRILVAREIYSDFLSEWVDAAARLRVGPASDPMTELGPLNHPEILDRISEHVATAVREGAHIETGGRSLAVGEGGFYYAPTVLTGEATEVAHMNEEVFGPVVLVSPFDDVDSAIEAANATPYGLAAYLFTADLGRALECADRLEAGSVWINRVHQSYPEAPFGGMKQSGLGREKSHFGVEEFTELKTLYLSY